MPLRLGIGLGLGLTVDARDGQVVDRRDALALLGPGLPSGLASGLGLG